MIPKEFLKEVCLLYQTSIHEYKSSTLVELAIYNSKPKIIQLLLKKHNIKFKHGNKIGYPVFRYFNYYKLTTVTFKNERGENNE